MRDVPHPYRVFARIALPDEGEIVLVTGHKFGDVKTLHDVNRNLYRLTKDGNIVWQVQRDDSNHPADWWDVLHKHAREQGIDGAREPFTEIRLEYADGSTSWDNQTYQWRNPCEWKPGCKIWLTGSAYQNYILDPETGIAKNVTDWPVRPW